MGLRKAFLVTVVGAMLLAFTAGVAWAAFTQCPGGRREGTMDSDQTDSSEVRDFIFAKAGDDDVEGGDGDIYGNEGGDVKLGDVVGSGDRDRIFGQGATMSWTPATRMASTDSTAARVATNCETTTEVAASPMW
jgi:hypothetical protein